MIKVGIYGASGYTGQELLRILRNHPGVEVIAVTSRRYAGIPVSEVFPCLIGLWDLRFENISPDEMAHRADIVFLALPHGISMTAVPLFLKSGRKVIDLSADFRLRDSALYEQWYGHHSAREFLAEAVYGIPELYRDTIAHARLVANPGCYPTSAILGLVPVLKAGWLDESSIIIDSKSGVSGAGREPQIGSLFCEVDGGFKPYKVTQHRHTPEIEQGLSDCAGKTVVISFTPHLLPVNRGILSTIYGNLNKGATAGELWDLYQDFYAQEKFVRMYPSGAFPNISAVRGSNFIDIGVTVDMRTKRAVIVSAIDNLIKGASGQAVQNMNLMCGFPEGAGLDIVPLYP